jgi:uncharacterized integral membrane protein
VTEWAYRDGVPDENEGRAGRLRGDRNPTVRLVAFVVIVGVLAWFALGNVERVKVSFLVVHTKVRLIYALAFAAVLGALADRLAVLIRRRR